MPGPIRKPLAHPAHAQMITSRAIELFEQMQRCRCTCDPDDRDHRFECPGCKRREALDEAIGVECKTPIWQYPCIENPRAENPYPPSHANYTWWETRDPAPRELWLALEQAVREMRQKEREARREAAEQPPTP